MSHPTRTPSRIAIIDLEHMGAASSLSTAFQDTGFAIVTGHGVSADVIRELHDAALRFFEQSLTQKQNSNNGCNEGYGSQPYVYRMENGAQLLGDFSKPNDIVESLTYKGLQRDEVQASLPLHLRDELLRFEASLLGLRTRLAVLCDTALGCEAGYMASHCDEDNEGLRLAHYPEVRGEEVQPGQLRYGAHVDSYGITLLHLDPENPEGLQVLVDDEWVDVPYVQDAFVLNVGALLSRWTNGFWKASVHRVVHYPGRRLSIVSGAVKPADDTMVEPLKIGGNPKYEPILAKNFIAERVAMHQPTYLEGKQVSSSAEAMRLGDSIRCFDK